MRRPRFVRPAGVLAAVLVMAGLAAAPASAASGPNIKVTAVAQQGNWLSGDTVALDVTVSNIGDAVAFGVFGTAYSESGTDFWTDRNQWGDLSDGGSGANIAQGETRTVHLTGQLGTFNGDSVVHIEVYAGNDVDYGDNVLRITLPMARGTERVAGVLYGDAPGDGKPSPGEALAGAEAHFIGVGTTNDLVSVTDATGHFHFDNLPLSRNAYVSFQKVPGGWVDQPVGTLRLDGRGAYTALEVRAVRPLSDVLHETIALDKTSYAAGDTAKVTVTLSNSGSKALTGLYLGCDAGGFGSELAITDDQWGAFGSQRREGTVAAGQRLVLTASGKVPDKAAYTGTTGLDCVASDGHSGGAPYAEVTAKVPGKRADSRGQVWRDKNGNSTVDADEGLANRNLVLLENGAIRAYARTDANGYATFKDIPVGNYQLRVLGPWKPAPFEGDLAVWAPPYGGGDWHQQFVAG
ncbi:hypothetical protein AB0J55_38105 [Amycolatopsis sp. NPDC049688]|uniref:hypothetical protein n=1 Tax=Amycolatopsis sp. NPDC049688 TaxID=3154733 RepID=UPI00343645CC